MFLWVYYQAFSFCLDLDFKKKYTILSRHHFHGRAVAKLATLVIILVAIIFLVAMATNAVAASSTANKMLLS